MALAGTQQQAVQPKPQLAPPTPEEMFGLARERTQKESPARLQAIIQGYFGVGKTSLFKTCEQSVERPVWVDAFDPNVRQVLRQEVAAGTIIVDDRWATYNFDRPEGMYEAYKRELELRIRNQFFFSISTFGMDSVTTLGNFMRPWGEEETRKQGKLGKVNNEPDIRSVYGNCQTELMKLFTRLLSMPCDLIVIAHPDEKEKDARELVSPQLIGRVKTPLGLFSEIWTLEAAPGAKSQPPERRVLIATDGVYMAKSCLNTNRDMAAVQPPDIQAIKRVAGLL